MDSEEEQFRALLAEKRHKELQNSMNSIAQAISTRDKSAAIVSAVEKQAAETKKFAEAVLSLPKPEVNVTVNQENILSSIEQMATTIIKGQLELSQVVSQQIIESQRLKEYECSFTYHPNGSITSSTIKQIK